MAVCTMVLSTSLSTITMHQTKFINSITSIYTNLCAEITMPSWSTAEIPLQVGVYQGDPLSIVIFNTGMCTLTEALQPYCHLGYTFTNSKHSLHLLQYADDACLLSDGPASCQELIRQVEKWLQWSGKKAKPAKCHSLGIRASSGASYDPGLVISGQPIQFINDQPIKFLGMIIQVPPDTNNIKSQVLQKLTRLLDRVDMSHVTRQQKLRLYRMGICPRIAWDLAINTFSISWVRGKL